MGIASVDKYECFRKVNLSIADDNAKKQYFQVILKILLFADKPMKFSANPGPACGWGLGYHKMSVISPLFTSVNESEDIGALVFILPSQLPRPLAGRKPCHGPGYSIRRNGKWRT